MAEWPTQGQVDKRVSCALIALLSHSWGWGQSSLKTLVALQAEMAVHESHRKITVTNSCCLWTKAINPMRHLVSNHFHLFPKISVRITSNLGCSLKRWMSKMFWAIGSPAIYRAFLGSRIWGGEPHSFNYVNSGKVWRKFSCLSYLLMFDNSFFQNQTTSQNSSMELFLAFYPEFHPNSWNHMTEEFYWCWNAMLRMQLKTKVLWNCMWTL